ncbi:hypothetical protein FRC04_008065 [Tulasnella sp. 424]|nr:hypothetical protein FRC04_008065 [Tulasnella sp. 424]
MDRVQTIGRPSAISRRNNRSRRTRNESSAYPRFNSFSAQDSRAIGVDNNNILPTPPQTQVSVAGISNDGKPVEISSNESFIFRLYDMVEDESVNAYIRWNETGDSIVIPDIEEFKMNALREYFDIPSRTTGTYVHKENKFRRGCRDSLRDIKRSEPHQGKTIQQDQPPRDVVNDSDTCPPSLPDGLSDPWNKILDLEQHNSSLKTELHKTKDALADLTRRHSRTEAALEELERRFEAFRLSFPPAAALGASSHTHEASPPAPFNPGGVAHASYSGSAAQRGLIDMSQPMIADEDHVTGPGTQSATGVSRPLVNARFQYPHYATPAAALPPQYLSTPVEPSPPSSAVRLPADPDLSYLPSSVTTIEQQWLGSSHSVSQQMNLDYETSAGVCSQNSTAPFIRTSRGSPRSLNTPMMIVQRRQPRDAIVDPGPGPASGHLSQAWSALMWG